MNKKIMFLGLLIVVLGLWVNAKLGCEMDIPVSYKTPEVQYVE